MRGWVLAALVLLGACTVYNADAPPGFRVQTRNPVGAVGEAVSGNYRHNYERLMLIAPPHAERCGVAPFGGAGAGPERRGPPNERGEVMVTVQEDRQSIRLFCDLPSGRIFRELDSIVIWRSTRDPDVVMRGFPPIVHVAGRDADSDGRWEAWQRTACPARRYQPPVCRQENIDALKRVDLN